jgi:hypothetical protein
MAIECPLDEVVLIDVITSHPTTGAATDADSTPTFAVYEEVTDTDIGVGGNLTKRTSLTGNYRGQFTASAANGFELGKFYTVVASATVNAIAGKCVVRTFRIVAGEAVAGYRAVDTTKWLGGTIPAVNVTGIPKVDPTHLLGTAWLTPGVAGTPDVNAKLISTAAILAIWHQLVSAVVTAGTMGKLLIDTLTGHTPQTGDSFGRIGAAGAGLTAVPWNAAWDAEVESEATDALNAYDPPTKAELDAAVSGLATDAGSALIYSRLGAPIGASVSADIAAAKADTAAILVDTNELQTDWVNGGRLDLLLDALPTTAQIADKYLNRNIAGGSDGGRMVKDALRVLRNKVTVVALSPTTATLSVYDETDAGTPAWTAVVTLDTTALPITAQDPA